MLLTAAHLIMVNRHPSISATTALFGDTAEIKEAGSRRQSLTGVLVSGRRPYVEQRKLCQLCQQFFAQPYEESRQ